MINLRVDHLDGMIAALEAKGVEILGRQDEDYGTLRLDPRLRRTSRSSSGEQIGAGARRN